MQRLAYASEVNLKSPLNSSSISNMYQTLSSSVDFAWLTISSFISSMEFLSLSLMTDRKLYIMTISPLEGMTCCISCLSRLFLRSPISFKLSWISLSIYYFRILNISLFFMPYFCFLNSDLLFLSYFICPSVLILFSCKFYRTFFFSLAFFDAEVLARKRQSLSFILPYPRLLSCFLSLLVLAEELASSYSSWSAWENASLSESLSRLLGVMMLMASLELFQTVKFYFWRLLILLGEFKEYQAIQQKQTNKLQLINVHQMAGTLKMIQTHKKKL